MIKNRFTSTAAALAIGLAAIAGTAVATAGTSTKSAHAPVERDVKRGAEEMAKKYKER